MPDLIPDPVPPWNEEVYQAHKRAEKAMTDLMAHAGHGNHRLQAIEAIACQLDLANKMTFAQLRRDRVL